MISNFRTFDRSFGVSQMFFFLGIKSSTGFPSVTPRTTCTGNFIHDVGLRFHRRSEFWSWEQYCCRVLNGLLTIVTSCFLRTRVKGLLSRIVQTMMETLLNDRSTVMKSFPHLLSAELNVNLTLYASFLKETAKDR